MYVGCKLNFLCAVLFVVLQDHILFESHGELLGLKWGLLGYGEPRYFFVCCVPGWMQLMDTQQFKLWLKGFNTISVSADGYSNCVASNIVHHIARYISCNAFVYLGRCIIRLTVMCTFNKINIKEASHAFDELCVHFVDTNDA